MSAVQYGGPASGTTIVSGGHYPTPSNVVVVQGHQQRQHLPGSCPYCGIGQPRKEFTLLGIILALLFFPLGVLCCLAMMETRCGHCNASL